MKNKCFKCVLWFEKQEMCIQATIIFVLFVGCLSKKIPIQDMKQSSQTVYLKVYQFNNFYYIRPSFNVTMTNIKWNGIVYNMFTSFRPWFHSTIFILFNLSQYSTIKCFTLYFNANELPIILRILNVVHAYLWAQTTTELL